MTRKGCIVTEIYKFGINPRIQKKCDIVTFIITEWYSYRDQGRSSFYCISIKISKDGFRY